MCNIPILNVDEVDGKQKVAPHKNIFMGESDTSIVRRTKQNVATLGVSLVVLGPLWGPYGPGRTICLS